MECVFCGGKTYISRTRRTADGRQYRRRTCQDCGETFTTYEVNEIDLFNMLDNYLPERLVDEISNKISKGFNKRDTKV